MTETFLNDLSSQYEDGLLDVNDGIDDPTKYIDTTAIPLLVLEPTTSSAAAAVSSLVRKDSIVIPSISNSSISSALQIENKTLTNTKLLPVCTSNSFGTSFFASSLRRT